MHMADSRHNVRVQLYPCHVCQYLHFYAPQAAAADSAAWILVRGRSLSYRTLSQQFVMC